MKKQNVVLSEREKEVARLFLMGYTYDGIGAKLFISAETVKKHLTKIYEKIGGSNKVYLTCYCIKRGICTFMELIKANRKP